MNAEFVLYKMFTSRHDVLCFAHTPAFNSTETLRIARYRNFGFRLIGDSVLEIRAPLARACSNDYFNGASCVCSILPYDILPPPPPLIWRQITQVISSK